MNYQTLIMLFVISFNINSYFGMVDKIEENGKSIKVIELFTSEGCSSCPPADELIRKINKEYEGKEVYILTYHVDYWNKLGWKDPFSSAAYSTKQYKYGQQFKLSSIYTPQVIVNGAVQFVGSDERRLRNELGKKETNNSVTTLKIGEIVIDKKNVKVSFSVNDDNYTDEIIISLVQKFATSAVGRGENRGRNLTHVQLVRDQKTVSVSSSTKMVSLILPDDFDAKQFEIIGFIQEKSSGKIINATSKSF